MIFVYRTTNLINGKVYIGVHDGDVDDSYLGSGVLLVKAIKKYGRKNFQREIIKTFDSKNAAYEFEKELVNEEFVKNEDNYNLTNGGRGGWSHAIKCGDDNWTRRPGAGKQISEYVKKSITQQLRDDRSKRMSELRKNGTIVKPKGWKHSDAAKLKMSENSKGQIPWNKGKKLPSESDETKRKKSESAKLRAQTQDMGALTRGQIRSPQLSCIKCHVKMYVKAFNKYHLNGKCWKNES